MCTLFNYEFTYKNTSKLFLICFPLELMIELIEEMLMVITGEILILVFGIHLSYACRNATTQFQERRFLCLAIVVEATVSGAFYILRIIYSKSLHPDYSFLAYFTRSQLTSTVVLLVIFTPKVGNSYFLYTSFN